MVESLLILLLLSGPGDEVLGRALAAELSRLGGDDVTLLLGAEAELQLREHGLEAADLLVAGAMGVQLTRHRPEIVILRIERNEHAGDVVVDARLWFDGQAERFASIAGEGGDPLPGLLGQLLPMLRHRLEGLGGGAAAASGLGDGPGDLARLIEIQAWPRALAVLAAIPDKSPREWYYVVLCHVRLEQHDLAWKALAAMRAEHGRHFLAAAAAELLPQAEAPSAEPDELPAADAAEAAEAADADEAD